MVSTATEQRQTSDAVTGPQLVDIEALYRAEYSRFVALATVLCGDADMGRDAVQDASPRRSAHGRPSAATGHWRGGCGGSS